MESSFWYKDQLLVSPMKLEEYTSEEVLFRLGNLLYGGGYVKKSYVNAIIEREKIYPTGLPTQPGVSIPHTDSSHVIDLALAVGILDKPVHFFEMGSEQKNIVDVSIVLALSIPDPAQIVKRLQLLFSVIQEPSFLNILTQLNNRNEISQLLHLSLNINFKKDYDVQQKEQNPEAEQKQSHEKSIIITHPVGLHARPASVFVQIAKNFSSEIFVLCNGRQANAKSILSILQLGASQGATILIRAKGEDQEKAINALVALVENNFGELP